MIAFAFSAVGMFLTTFMRSWVDFDYVNLAILPMFLFSATFFPLSTYPEGVRWLVEITPLYQGVALERGLMLGEVDAGLLWHVGYFVVLGDHRAAGDRTPAGATAAVVTWACRAS